MILFQIRIAQTSSKSRVKILCAFSHSLLLVFILAPISYTIFGDGFVREAYDGEPIIPVLANAINYRRILFPRHPDDRTPLPQEPQSANGPMIHVHGTINVFENLRSQHSEGSPAVLINIQAVHGILPSMTSF